jgi:hypothetical protein
MNTNSSPRTKKDIIFDWILENGNSATRKEIICKVMEINRPGEVYSSKNRGLYSTAFDYYKGHFRMGPRQLHRNEEGKWSVYNRGENNCTTGR